MRAVRLGAALLAGQAVLAGCASPSRNYQDHVNYLASDELEGRGVGSKGLDRAADYIVDEFKRAGLAGGGENGAYVQTFQLARAKELGGGTFLSLSGVSGGVSRGVDYTPLGFTNDQAFDAEVVFCGYGIDSDERDHHDFAHLDLEGKAALMLRGEPPSWSAGGEPSLAAALRAKVYAARERGAVAVLFVNAAPAEGEADELMPFEGDRPDNYGVPAFQITRSLADKVLRAGALDHLEEVQRRLDGGQFVSAKVAGVRAAGRAELKPVNTDVRNVIGVLAGQGPLAGEWIVIGAHYDHLGKVAPMQRRFKGGKLVQEKSEPQIHNGADDNASGTAGLIEAAKALASGAPPRRSIAFVAFTAEESGLHGSEYFMDHLAQTADAAAGAGIARDRIVAMLNMDMIGRLPADGRLEVFGSESGKEFEEILKRRSAEAGVQIAASAATSGRSDDAPFYRAGVPSLHFCTGTHADYHKPSDDADKINVEGAERVVRLVTGVARDLAEAPDRPTLVKGLRAPTVPSAGDAAPVYRVVMGLTPSYGEDGQPGMKVQDVSPDGPAEVAGMKPGDRIVRIGKMTVNNIYDYMGATTGNRAGDQVEVEVTREGKSVVLNVTLAPAR